MKWISVKDRLPETDDYVLACDGYGVSMACLWHGMWISYANDELNTESITHWMPLPKPPEVEK